MSGKHGDKGFDIRLLDGRRETLNYRVREEEIGSRLDHFLTGRLTWRSRTSVRRLLDEGLVQLVGGPSASSSRSARASRRMLAGDVVTIKLPRTVRDEEHAARVRRDVALVKLFEDDVLIGIDKPPNIAVHPSGRLIHWTVITELHRQYRDFDDPLLDVVPKLCHRLDLETSGVLLVSKTQRALIAVQQQFERRKVKKEYLVLVHGRVPDDEGFIDLPIGPTHSGHVRNARTIRHDVGQPSRTKYTVRQRYDGYTLCHVDLLTGRHHQIRVHFSAIGFPVVGDKIYGRDDEIFLRYSNRTITEDDWRLLELPRQALHSHALTFEHPQSGLMRVESPLPPDIAEFCDGLVPE